MGRNRLIIPKAIDAAIQLATAKFRSSKSDSGTSGSAWKRSQITNSTSSTAPRPITSGMVTTYEPISPQLKRSPSMRPKTTPNRPAVARKMPTTSHPWRRPGRRSGMITKVATSAAIPIGTLTKKIQRQSM